VYSPPSNFFSLFLSVKEFRTILWAVHPLKMTSVFLPFFVMFAPAPFFSSSFIAPSDLMHPFSYHRGAPGCAMTGILPFFLLLLFFSGELRSARPPPSSFSRRNRSGPCRFFSVRRDVINQRNHSFRSFLFFFSLFFVERDRLPACPLEDALGFFFFRPRHGTRRVAERSSFIYQLPPLS